MSLPGFSLQKASLQRETLKVGILNLFENFIQKMNGVFLFVSVRSSGEILKFCFIECNSSEFAVFSILCQLGEFETKCMRIVLQEMT